MMMTKTTDGDANGVDDHGDGDVNGDGDADSEDISLIWVGRAISSLITSWCLLRSQRRKARVAAFSTNNFSIGLKKKFYLFSSKALELFSSNDKE